jgi:hypothetical protein
MRAIHLLISVLLAASCQCQGNAHITGSGGGNGGSGNGAGGAGGSGGGVVNNGLLVTPPDATLDITQGGAAATTHFTATLIANGSDVSASAQWTLDNPAVGTINGGTFTASGAAGGTVLVQATYNGSSGQALLHLRLHASGGSCMGCPTIPPLNPTPPSCGAPAAPQLVYPADGVLLPPNMNVIEVQFMPGVGTNAYEIDFTNGTTEVRLSTPCVPITDTRGVATGGCGFTLDPTMWKWVATTNRGGDPVTVSVRATTDGSCASPSNSVAVSFAQQDLNGGLYYWQSLVVGGIAGKTGGIYRYDFGNPSQAATAFLTPASGSCVGCHFLSRDGTRMTYSTDDADSDDEYGDMSGHLLNVGTKGLIVTTSPSGRPLPPGFQTLTHDAKLVMASTGLTVESVFRTWNAQTGGAPVGQMMTGMRGTQPDWSADDSKIVFVIPTKFATAFAPLPYLRGDDDHFLGGSLYTATFDGTNFGTPAPLVMATTAQNNYYPSWSPDSSFVVFNRVDDDPASTTDLSQDAYNNPLAKVWVLSTTSGAKPVEAAKLNGDARNTNSWPRWSPFVQTYKGQRLLWVTFSSTRDYGLHVRNHTTVGGLPQVNCYPPDSPQNLVGSHTQPLPANCNQPQIWMAAINLSTAELVTAGGDPSFPAFWLPFQEVTAHNHIAQWTQTVVVDPGACDGGQPACLMTNAACGPSVCGTCCNGDICQAGVCQPGIN